MVEKRIVINTNTAREIKNIIQRYIDRYGNITLSELLNKFDTNFLVLN